MATSPPRKPSKKAKSLIESADVPIQFGVPTEAPVAVEAAIPLAADPVIDADLTEDALDMPELSDALDMSIETPVEAMIEVVAAPALQTALPEAAEPEPMTAAAIAPVELEIAPIDLSRVELAPPPGKPEPAPPQPTPTQTAKKGLSMDEMKSTVNDTMTKTAGMMHGATETMQSAASDMQARGTAMMGDLSGRAKSAMEKGTKAVEELVEFQKGNLEALMTSGRTATSGAQEIAKYSAEYGRATIEKANATARQFASVKSPTEFFQLQGEIAKQMLDGMVAEGAKFTESYMKLMGEVAQPLSNRMAVAVDKVKSTVGNQS